MTIYNKYKFFFTKYNQKYLKSLKRLNSCILSKNSYIKQNILFCLFNGRDRLWTVPPG